MWRLVAVAVLALGGGCNALLSIHGFAAGDDTAATDAPSMVGDAVCASWHPHDFEPCALPAPIDLVVPTGHTYVLDADAGTLTDDLGVGIPIASVVTANGRVVSTTEVVIGDGATLRAVGANTPLVLAAFDRIVIGQNGVIDAGSHRGDATSGAGDATGLCRSGPGADEADTGGGSGGGAGGGFQGIGGNGGPGDTNAQNPGGVAVGGQILPPDHPRAGCRGGPSGRAGPDPAVTDHEAVAAGGEAGGAIAIVAQGTIDLGQDALIAAGGEGGAGTALGESDGGGGGGAGGYISLEAAALSADHAATLAANGGAGGGGAAFAATGLAGEDGGASAAAVGAPPTTCTAASGDGSFGTSFAGGNASQMAVSCGGGGGGGGAGFIVLRGVSAPASLVVSPPAL